MNKPLSRQVAIYALLLTLMLPVFLTTVNAQQSDLTATNVTGTLNVNGSPDEAFWSTVTSYNISLTGSNPYGGKEDKVTVKIATNGTTLFILAKWNDPTESRKSMTRVTAQPAIPGQYLANSTYYYGDLFFVVLWMGDGTPTQTPFVTGHPGGGGKPSNWGANDNANIWSWRAYYTDQGAPAFPHLSLWNKTSGSLGALEKYNFGPNKGQNTTFPYSWAWDLHMNKTGNWLIDGYGILHSVSCTVPGFPYAVRAMGTWNNGAWTLEIARPLTPPAENQAHSITLTQGKTYSIAFAAADGGQGETEQTNSISSWKTLALPQTTDYTLLYLAGGAGVVVVALGAFVLYRRSHVKAV